MSTQKIALKIIMITQKKCIQNCYDGLILFVFPYFALKKWLTLMYIGYVIIKVLIFFKKKFSYQRQVASVQTLLVARKATQCFAAAPAYEL